MSMMNKLTEGVLKHRVMTVFAYALVFFLGYRTLQTITIDVLPDLTRPNVTVLVEAPGFAPEEVEKQITIPIENALSGTVGMVRLTSTSAMGYAIIKSEFDFGTDPYLARQMTNERLAEISGDLPSFAKLKMGPVASIMGEIMLIGLTAKDETVSGMELLETAVYKVQRRLKGIGGVASVSSTGGDVTEYQVILDPVKMRELDVTIEQARDAVQKSSVFASGGVLKENGTEKIVRIKASAETVEDLKKAVVNKPDFKGSFPITLEQVADIKIAPQFLKRGDAYINGKPGILISIQKQPESDTLRLTQRIEKELDEIRHTLPDGIEVHDKLFRQEQFINAAADNIKDALLMGSFLIALVLILLIRNWRATAVVLTVIPTTFVMTVLVFKAFGLGVNTMTLGGLAMALGSLVDDAIVMTENIFKHLRNKTKSKTEVIMAACKEVRGSVIFSTVLIFFIFLPLFALSGIEGKIFKPLALSFMIAMICSTVVALTLTPVLSSFKKQKKEKEEHDPALIEKLKSIQTKGIAFCFKHGRMVMGGLTLLFIGAVVYLVVVGKTFLPPFNEGSFNVSLAIAPGTSLEMTGDVIAKIEKRLLAVDEIESIGRKSGRMELDEHALPVSVSEMEIRLKEGKKRPREEIENAIRQACAFPGVVVNISQPITHRIDFILSGAKSQIALKVFGADVDMLRKYAGQIQAILSETKGLVDVQIDPVIKVPEISIELDRGKARRLGIQAADFGKDVETMLQGEAVAQILKEERAYDVVLRMKRLGNKQTADVLKHLPVGTIAGKTVPLASVAKIRETSGISEIPRENNMRRLMVYANLQDRDLVSAVREIEKHISEDLKLPEGYYIKIDGQYETQGRAMRDMMILAGVAGILMIGVLMLHFKKAVLVTLTVLSVPFALMGGVAGIMFAGGILSLASCVGLITLSGIALRNGLLLFEIYLNVENEEGRKALTEKRLADLTTQRLLPILMTTLTSIIGLIPLILNGNSPGKEMLYPASCVIIFGLVSTTVISLFITPVLFKKYYLNE